MEIREGRNPIICMDYPDPDVIRVEDTYYMISTTMHFMPGGEILRSYDLINWEVAAYVYDVLEDTPDQRLEGVRNSYGKGMWAASLRYYKGTFYVCFVANDTHKTYLYQSEKIEGPWRKQYIEGFYHDCSLLFDDDGRIYIVYGNTNIYLTELKADLSGPKPGGIHRKIIEDKNNVCLGYEGSHFYKINGKYYLFLIHWHKDGTNRRTESCFVAESIEGIFRGRDVLDDDLNYRNSGVAQGGIVSTPKGDWYAVLFQDRGAVGRIPVVVPVHFERDFPVFGADGKVSERILTESTRPSYSYKPLTSSDDFMYQPDAQGNVRLKSAWQWNHIPKPELWSVTEKPGSLRITTDKICQNMTYANNVLTQRTRFPFCEAIVEVDGTDLQEGDYAGLGALQSCYGMIALKKEHGKYFLVRMDRNASDAGLAAMPEEFGAGEESACIPFAESKAEFKVSMNFKDGADEAAFYYSKAGEWVRLGPVHKLYFKLDHFTGCRFGLFVYSTKQTGGTAQFRKFVYL